MFGRENELIFYLLGLGLGSALLSGLLTWLVARRYGRRRALVVPIMAVVAVAVMLWRRTGTASDYAVEAGAFAMIFAGPAIAGALLGLLLSRRKPD